VECEFRTGDRRPELAPRAEVSAPDLAALLAMDDDAFTHRYGDTPFARPGRAGMRRNAAAVLDE